MATQLVERPDLTVPIGLSRDENHVYTVNYPGEPVRSLTSITTAMKAVDKSNALVGWAKRFTAEIAVRNLPMLSEMSAMGGEQAAIDYLKSLADHKKEKAGDRGTRVHEAADALSRGEEVHVSEEDAPYVNAFQRYLAEWQPVCIASEYMVCSLVAGYAGTGDRVDRIPCPFHGTVDRWRLDIKTMELDARGKPKGPYTETALQLAAAHFADFSGRPGDPKKYVVPQAEHCAVLALRSDGSYALVPYEVTQDTFEAFCAFLRGWWWLQGPAKTVIGQPLVLRERVAA